MIDPISIPAALAVAKGLGAAAGRKAIIDGGSDFALRTAGGLLTKATRMLQEGQSIRSLADYSRPARVEPLVIVEESLQDIPAMADVMKSVSSIFIGYYLQAAVFTGTKIGSIDPLKVFDRLNPDRSRTLVQRGGEVVFSKESYDEGLPSFEQYSQPEPTGNLIVSIEKAKDKDDVKPDGVAGHHASVDSAEKIFEANSLVVGKLIQVELQEGEHKGKFPIMVRLAPAAVKTGVITHIFTAASKGTSIKEQYHMWRAGQISFWRDLVFQTNLIDQHRKALVNDTSNIYQTITDRRRENTMSAASTKQPSMADASNILVVSKDTAREIGRQLYGKVENLNTRRKLFDSTYLLLFVVVDELHERVTIYHRGYDKPTTASFNDIKSSEKGKGPDFTEILKAYVAGATPNMI